MAVGYMIWLTTACNLKCKYCYEGTAKVNCYLSKDYAAKIVDYIVQDCDKTKNLQISFHGGEPFLNYKIMEFISLELENQLHSVVNDISYQVTTNATILNEEIIEFLKDHKIEVTCSLDGTKETHDSCNLLEYLTQRDIQTKNSGVNVRYRGKHRFFKGFNEFIKEKTRRCDNDFEKIERHVFF